MPEVGQAAQRSILEADVGELAACDWTLSPLAWAAPNSLARAGHANPLLVVHVGHGEPRVAHVGHAKPLVVQAGHAIPLVVHARHVKQPLVALAEHEVFVGIAALVGHEVAVLAGHEVLLGHAALAAYGAALAQMNFAAGFRQSHFAGLGAQGRRDVHVVRALNRLSVSFAPPKTSLTVLVVRASSQLAARLVVANSHAIRMLVLDKTEGERLAAWGRRVKGMLVVETEAVYAIVQLDLLAVPRKARVVVSYALVTHADELGQPEHAQLRECAGLLHAEAALALVVR